MAERLHHDDGDPREYQGARREPRDGFDPEGFGDFNEGDYAGGHPPPKREEDQGERGR